MWCRSHRSEIDTPSTRCSLTMATFCWGEKCLRSREFDPFLAASMESSFASRYANARDGKFQFRLRQDTLGSALCFVHCIDSFLDRLASVKLAARDEKVRAGKSATSNNNEA